MPKIIKHYSKNTYNYIKQYLYNRMFGNNTSVKCKHLIIKNFSKLTLCSLLLKILIDGDVTTSFDKELHDVIQRCEKK